MVRVAHFDTIGCRTPICSISRPLPPAQTPETLSIAGRSCPKCCAHRSSSFRASSKNNFSRDFVLRAETLGPWGSLPLPRSCGVQDERCLVLPCIPPPFVALTPGASRAWKWERRRSAGCKASVANPGSARERYEAPSCHGSIHDAAHVHTQSIWPSWPQNCLLDEQHGGRQA